MERALAFEGTDTFLMANRSGTYLIFPRGILMSLKYNIFSKFLFQIIQLLYMELHYLSSHFSLSPFEKRKAEF